MVEIDTPGHTAIISEAHPDYVACPQARLWLNYANGRRFHFLSFCVPLRSNRAAGWSATVCKRDDRKVDCRAVLRGCENVSFVDRQHGR